jgi:ADP-ribose pyrophosphatase
MSYAYEEVVYSKTAFVGRLLHVRVDTVRTPEGIETTREVVVHPGAVAVVPLIANDVILVEQWRQAIGAVSLEIPAGTLHPGESPESCAQRELLEETGYQAGRLSELYSLALTPGYSSEIIHVYIAEDLRPGEGQRDLDEKVTVKRLGFDEVVRRCLAGELPDAKTVAGILTVALRRLN